MAKQFPERPSSRPSAWAHPGEDAPTSIRIVGETIGKSDSAKVVLNSIQYFPSGYLLDLTASAEAPSDLRDKESINAWRNRNMAMICPPKGLLTIEIYLRNGYKMTPFDYIIPPPDEPQSPILREISGAGYAALESGIWLEPKLWLWPAINESVSITVEWPLFAIPATKSVVDFRNRD